jgi:indolepyruvate ferredoxin oxidoreductase
VFANLGDGTYFHSGLLAIRQSIAAGVNITYKILYNDAVAMTGGQPLGERPEGHSVVQIANSVTAEGARRVVIVTDQPEKYDGVNGLPSGVTIHHRDELDRIQRELRDTAGCTALIYDQTCATEKRRRRKRGKMVDPAVRVFINELVCEGCGDCSVQSNCISVEPLETEFGRKRTINQSTCNKDLSCLKGFCPSFVTVEGGQLKKAQRQAQPTPESLGELPEPILPSLSQAAQHGGYGIVVAGVGGTGVITIGQVLGMAAHIEGLGIVTQDAAGLAQKGGATWSHVLMAPRFEDIRTTRVALGAADLILGCDPIVSAGKETLLRMGAGRTRVALNANSTPTASFIQNSKQWENPSDRCVAAIGQTLEGQGLGTLQANAMATTLMGDTIFVNPMVMGFAWQKGWLPVRKESIHRAMELNGVQVKANQLAFEWGRWAAHAPERVADLLQPAQRVQFQAPQSLQAMVDQRAAFLTAYQNQAYAQSYRDFVAGVAQRSDTLARVVARQLFKLMAYKDEYEVARLHTQTDVLQRVADRFEGDFKIHHHLAPPLLAKRNERGELTKQKFGSAMRWALSVLPHFKGLRGTALDPFGYTEERRTERALIGEYRALIEEVMQGDLQGRKDLALQLANLPEEIKGYGHVKARNLTQVRARWQALLGQWRA